ncbi:MAG: MBOAT family O-acyltransferase [Desulfuromonadaceae bacterium]
MAFQSYHFLIFFICVFFGTHILAKISHSLKKDFLLLASYYFYSCWDWRFSGLIFSITVINYIIGPLIYRAKEKRIKVLWLWLSLAPSLLILAYFKYTNFFIGSFIDLLAVFDLQANLHLLNIILPVGISFYTFQSISYTLDIYRGRTTPVHSFRDFALFVAFFPQLVAGPIVRASHFLPQLDQEPAQDDNAIESGFALIMRGFIKKVIIADVLALHIVDPAFAQPSDYSPIFLLVALYSYSYQVYMDFSGYTDIARGAAKSLGYELQINFNRPYKSQSISEFWQRWHISMSSFFRDYLYFGLGGSKYGNVYVNLVITFVAIGIWHGAGWNFVVYGLCHGGFVGCERWARTRRKRLGLPEKVLSPSRRVLKIFFIFNLVSLTRILFRGGSLSAAVEYLDSILSFDRLWIIPLDVIGVTVLIVAIIFHYVPDFWTFRWKDLYLKIPTYVQAPLIVLVVYLMVAFSSKSAPFIYFQF